MMNPTDLSDAELREYFSAAIIGDKNRSPVLDRLLDEFQMFTDLGGSFRVTWNWSAFFFGTLWFAYRKMYVAFALFGLITILTGVRVDSVLLVIN